MPTGYVKKLAKQYGVSVKTAEGEWEDAKTAAEKSYDEGDPAKWGTTMNIFKAKMKAHHGGKKKKSRKKNENLIQRFDSFNETFEEKELNINTTFDEFLNEDKKYDQILYELAYLRKKIDRIDVVENKLKTIEKNVSTIEKRLSSVENTLVDVIKLNNLKYKK
jgi:hypothetical protein